MKITDRTRRILRIRRERRDMLREGWEYVGDDGGRLWELDRGRRMGKKITDVRIAADGLGLWVKVEGVTLADVYTSRPGDVIHD